MNSSKVSNVTKSQRRSIYSCDLIASLILCIISEVNGYDMYGYKWQYQDTFRLKDEQDEFCLNAYAIQNMIDWTSDFKCNTFIDDLSSKYNSSELNTLHDKNSKSGKKSKASTKLKISVKIKSLVKTRNQAKNLNQVKRKVLKLKRNVLKYVSMLQLKMEMPYKHMNIYKPSL